ncbi:hypothetical protein EZS27_022425 [termite gut metagenome]|uniref:Uncharacterized protein n=1 Tax=termite gut metagenome TaxID=433724 RepID=A0A5J4R555_9ZZZZ
MNAHDSDKTLLNLNQNVVILASYGDVITTCPVKEIYPMNSKNKRDVLLTVLSYTGIWRILGHRISQDYRFGFS